MKRVTLPSTALVSTLAALCTWLVLTTWTGFSDAPWRYLGPLLLACALVAITGALLRSARLHVLLVLLGQLAVIAIYLNHRFAPDPSILGWLPTPGSVRDSLDALSTSIDTAKAYAAPVPESVPSLPPILISVGALLAVVVDLLAVGLRRVPLAGLPLLAMYTAPISLLDGGVPWWKFILVAVVFLALLAGEESVRLGHWGRDLGADADEGAGWLFGANRTVWPSARRIGLSATGLAVVLPLFIPTFTSGILAGTGSGDGDGENGVRITNPILNIKRDLARGDDVPLVKFSTEDPAPAYLRFAVLDEFDDGSWKPGKRAIPVEQRADGELPPPVGLDPDVTSTQYEWHFEIDDGFKSGWLPLPFPALNVQAPGDWRYDLSTMDLVSAADGETTAGIEYDALGLDVDPTADQLKSAGAVPSDIFNRYADDSGIPDWVGELAADVTAAGTNRAERAALLQDWFSLPHEDSSQDPSFTYNIDRAADSSSIEALTDFLQNSRTGYCEQFAAAMTMMARTLSIPARIAVGFLKPTAIGDNTWVFSTHDLHAWPELYFQDVGWVRFEPTPGSREGTEAPSYTAGLRPSAQPTQAPTTSAPTQSTSPTARPTVRNLEEEQLNSGGGGVGSRSWWLLYFGTGLAVVVLVGATPRLVRSIVRRRRWSGARTTPELAEAAWAELRDSMVDLRLPWDDTVTVRQRAGDIAPLFCRNPGKGEEDLARVIRNNPAAEAALDRILLLLERARYARTVPDPDDVRGDVALCVKSLRIGVEQSTRIKADWLPVSLLRSRGRRGAMSDSGIALSEPSLTR